MTETNRHLEHLRVASSVPEVKLLTDENNSNIGSYLIPEVRAGDFVPLAGRHAIEADFDAIEVLTDGRDFSEELIKFSTEVEESPQYKETKKALEKLTETEKELFISALFAAEIASEFFSGNKVDRETRDKMGWTPIDAKREDTYNLKKLSETSDQGLCVEVSLVVGELMRRLGHDTSYIVGYRQFWPDEPAEYHAFLTADDGRNIVDPLLLMRTMHDDKLQGLMQTVGETTVISNPRDIQLYRDIFNRPVRFSASPIPVVDEAQVAA